MARGSDRNALGSVQTKSGLGARGQVILPLLGAFSPNPLPTAI